MTLLTQELLKKKLSTWVLSSKVPGHLGFDESKGLEIKQELQALVEMGLVQREGERRGLKFRFKPADGSVSEESEDSIEEDDLPPIKQDEVASLHAFFADRDSIKAETAGKTPLQLMSVITNLAIKDPSVTSHTLAYKRTAEGNIVVTFWQGCVKQYNKEYSIAEFQRILTKELKNLAKPIPA